MKIFHHIFSINLLTLSIILASACAAPKTFVYLNDMVPGEQFDVIDAYSITIQNNDRLDIKVSSKNPELALPFNSAYGQIPSSVSLDDISTALSSDKAKNEGYRVDMEGDIVFPIIGKIHVAGLTLKEASTLIEQRIESGKYINNPHVSIDFLNFKYTVLGAVNGKGTYSVDGDRVTLIEAIARAGDLSSNAALDKIAVIRNIDGKQEIFYNDIRSSEIFKSPTYYLKQNDIVYVIPRYKDSSNSEKAWRAASITLGAATAISSLIYAITGIMNLTK